MEWLESGLIGIWVQLLTKIFHESKVHVSNLRKKYTNPAYGHTWLLQAKVVGPSYGTHIHLTCEEISKTCIVYETCLCICNRQAVLDCTRLRNREAVLDCAILCNREAVLSYAILYNREAVLNMQYYVIKWVIWGNSFSDLNTENEEKTKQWKLKRPPSGRGLITFWPPD